MVLGSTRGCWDDMNVRLVCILIFWVKLFKFFGSGRLHFVAHVIVAFEDLQNVHRTGKYQNIAGKFDILCSEIQ